MGQATAFLQDGRSELDNNRSERSIKPFVIGRKNWLFANTPNGARSSAVTYSMVETANENGLNPFTYMTHLFEQLPNVDTTNPAVLDALLPWSANLPAVCRVPAPSTLIHSAFPPTRNNAGRTTRNLRCLK